MIPKKKRRLPDILHKPEFALLYYDRKITEWTLVGTFASRTAALQKKIVLGKELSHSDLSIFSIDFHLVQALLDGTYVPAIQMFKSKNEVQLETFYVEYQIGYCNDRKIERADQLFLSRKDAHNYCVNTQ